MDEGGKTHDALQEGIQEAIQARNVLMQVITRLYANRDRADVQTMFAYFQKDEEAFRAHIQSWLLTVENFSGTPQEKMSMFIITALYAPTLNTLARVCMSELKQVSTDKDEGVVQWQTATALVNTWKLVEQSLKERFSLLPEGQVREHVTPVITNISQSFSTVLPARRVH